MSTNNLIAIRKLAKNINYNVDMLYPLFHNICSTNNSHQHIFPILMKIIKNLPLMANHEFIITPNITRQFTHSDCYILAEHLLYLFHEKPDITVTYVHVEQFVSVHGFIQINYQDRDFYIDAGGIYSSMTSILDRYELTVNDVNISLYSGKEVMNGSLTDKVCNLSEITNTKELLQTVSDTLNLDESDLEQHVLNNVLSLSLGIDHQHMHMTIQIQ